MNIYYEPEKFGLEIVATLEASVGYEFDMVVAWRNPVTRALYIAADSGCSCPEPFANVGVPGLTPVNSFTQLISAAEALRSEYSQSGYPTDADRIAFCRKVWDARE